MSKPMVHRKARRGRALLVNLVRKSHRGQVMLEFFIVLPIVLLLIALVVKGGWVVFTQMVADYSSFEGARAGSVNRGDTALPWLASGVFAAKAEKVAGERTLQAIGEPGVSQDTARFLRLQDSTHFDLGIFGQLHLGAGAAPRLQQFFPGPPSPWE